jgi:hypothetical protein
MPQNTIEERRKYQNEYKRCQRQKRRQQQQQTTPSDDEVSTISHNNNNDENTTTLRLINDVDYLRDELNALRNTVSEQQKVINNLMLMIMNNQQQQQQQQSAAAAAAIAAAQPPPKAALVPPPQKTEFNKEYYLLETCNESITIEKFITNYLQTFKNMNNLMDLLKEFEVSDELNTPNWFIESINKAITKFLNDGYNMKDLPIHLIESTRGMYAIMSEKKPEYECSYYETKNKYIIMGGFIPIIDYFSNSVTKLFKSHGTPNAENRSETDIYVSLLSAFLNLKKILDTETFKTSVLELFLVDKKRNRAVIQKEWIAAKINKVDNRITKTTTDNVQQNHYDDIYGNAILEIIEMMENKSAEDIVLNILHNRKHQSIILSEAYLKNEYIDGILKSVMTAFFNLENADYEYDTIKDFRFELKKASSNDVFIREMIEILKS